MSQAVPDQPREWLHPSWHEFEAIKPFEILRARRTVCGLSQADLATLADLGHSTIKAMETGRGTLTGPALPAVARALALDPNAPVSRLQELLPPEAVHIVMAAMIGAASNQSIEARELAGRRVRTEWHALVNDLAAGNAEAATVEALLRVMAGRLSPQLMRQFIDALNESGRVNLPFRSAPNPAADPVGFLANARGFLTESGAEGLSASAWASTAHPAVQAIAASGLPAHMQGALFEHLGRRREQMEAALLTEISTLIETLSKSTDG